MAGEVTAGEAVMAVVVVVMAVVEEEEAVMEAEAVAAVARRECREPSPLIRSFPKVARNHKLSIGHLIRLSQLSPQF